MENKQEEEKMKSVSNLVQDLKGEVEIKDSITEEELSATHQKPKPNVLTVRNFYYIDTSIVQF